MPFISLTDYHGHPARVDSAKVLRLRPALANLGDPTGCTLVDFASGGLFALGDLQEIGMLFSPYVRLASLHAPDGTPLLINADAIAAVTIDPAYAGNSVAVVNTDFENVRVPQRNKIGLNEDVATAQTILDAAAVI